MERREIRKLSNDHIRAPENSGNWDSEIEIDVQVGKNFEDKLEKAVLEVLDEVFGLLQAEKIVYMMAKLNRTSRYEVLRDPKALNFGLLGLFGTGGKIIQRMILKKLRAYTEAEINIENDFLDEIEKIRSSLSYRSSYIPFGSSKIV